MTTPDELEKVPKELFDRVWEIVKICDDREKHFNTLQSQYRTLASTWLLAAFGGIGFVLSTKLSAPLPWESMVSGIAAAGAIGLALLWILDVLVYHELLIIGYVAGQQLERALGWLPPIRSHFGKRREPLPVRAYVAVFYMGGIVALCLGAGLILLTSGSLSRGRAGLLILVAAGLLAIIYGLTRHALQWTKNIPIWIQ